MTSNLILKGFKLFLQTRKAKELAQKDNKVVEIPTPEAFDTPEPMFIEIDPSMSTTPVASDEDKYHTDPGIHAYVVETLSLYAQGHTLPQEAARVNHLLETTKFSSRSLIPTLEINLHTGEAKTRYSNKLYNEDDNVTLYADHIIHFTR